MSKILKEVLQCKASIKILFKEFIVYSSQIINDVEVFRVENDVNGNPRYVIHFLELADRYNDALIKARKIGGKKYRAKWFCGGIVFSSYNLKHDLKIIIVEEK